MEFSTQEYWTGLPFPSPGDLLDPGIKLASLMSPALAGGSFIPEPPGEAHGNTEEGTICALGNQGRLPRRGDA